MSLLRGFASLGLISGCVALVGACSSSNSGMKGAGGLASGGPDSAGSGAQSNSDSGTSGVTASSGAAAAEAAGGAGNGCSFARAEPFDPGPPIPVRYTVFRPEPSQAGTPDTAPLPAYWEFSKDCGSIKDWQGFDAAPWGECVARHQVDFLNRAFQTLMSTTKPMFEFAAVQVVYDGTLGNISAFPDTAYAVERLQHSPYNAPPGLNVIVAGLPSFESVEGRAIVRQDFPVYGGVLVLVNFDVPAAVLTHEVGHVVGYGHADLRQSYPCCGGLSALPDICSENIMCSGTKTLNSCHQGEFLREVAQCWWSRKGNAQCEEAQCNTYTDDGSLQSLCLGRADGSFACTCQQNEVTYLAASCDEARTRSLTSCH